MYVTAFPLFRRFVLLFAVVLNVLKYCGNTANLAPHLKSLN